MEKKLYTGIAVFVAIVLVLAFLFPAKKKVYNLSERSFSTKSSTTLYFKNTRAFYYAMAEMPEAGIDVYRFGKTVKTEDVPQLNFIIVHNWRADEVYIVTEPNEVLLSMGMIDVKIGDSLVAYNKTTMNNEAQYDFAAMVFQAMLNQEKISMNVSGEPLFGSLENEKANLTVLEDYFKWVYKYR